MTVPIAYPVIIGLAIAAAIALSRVTQQRLVLSTGQKVGIEMGGFIGAMLGAKLPFVLADWTGMLSGAAWFSDGKTILFGLVGGYFGVVVAKWSLDIHTRTGDSFAVPVAAAVAIGRCGCFVAGCCFGTPTSLPWGVFFPGVDNQTRHPTQIYEFVFHATMALVLYALWRRRMLQGQLIKLYILAYAGYRFLSEFIRPEVRLWAGLTGYQWACLVLAVLFFWLWWRDAKELKAQGLDPTDVLDSSCSQLPIVR
jgi:phosphatidylglycerol:prolipoprotein diacylglycerol transferase